jgi:hypothetical protein
MVEPHVSLDPASLDPVETKLRGPLEEQLTSALQAAADKIEAAYAGETVDVITMRLLDETRHGLHPDIAAAWSPDMAELQRIAQAIVAERR